MYDLKGGDDCPEVAFGGGEVVELLAWAVELAEGGVRGRDPEPMFLCDNLETARGVRKERPGPTMNQT